MSSDVPAVRKAAPLPVPRTAVPFGIQDPVEKARAELKAALAAIEEKANVPKRIARAGGEAVENVRVFAKKQPVLAVGAVVAAALAVGAAVWGAVRLYTR